MIKLFTGIPGCGKTYRAVYELQKESSKYYVFHNIDSLKMERFENGQFIKDFSKLDQDFISFFSVDNQSSLCAEIKEKYGRQVLIIIDEAQSFLAKVNPVVMQWLSYHRHLGQDVWLITQNRYNIAREYNNLVEVEVQGKRGFVFNSFIYSWFASGERFKTDKLPKDKAVFDLYQSFNVEEQKKKKSGLWRFMIIMGVSSVALGALFFFYLMPKMHSDASGKLSAGKKEKAAVKGSPNAKMLSAADSVHSNPTKYFYVGSLLGRAIVSDISGNVWFLDQLTDYETQMINEKNLALVIDGKKGSKILRVEPVQARAAGSGREPASGQGFKGDVVLKKVYVDCR